MSFVFFPGFDILLKCFHGTNMKLHKRSVVLYDYDTILLYMGLRTLKIYQVVFAQLKAVLTVPSQFDRFVLEKMFVVLPQFCSFAWCLGGKIYWVRDGKHAMIGE